MREKEREKIIVVFVRHGVREKERPKSIGSVTTKIPTCQTVKKKGARGEPGRGEGEKVRKVKREASWRKRIEKLRTHSPSTPVVG